MKFRRDVIVPLEDLEFSVDIVALEEFLHYYFVMGGKAPMGRAQPVSTDTASDHVIKKAGVMATFGAQL